MILKIAKKGNNKNILKIINEDLKDFEKKWKNMLYSKQWKHKYQDRFTEETYKTESGIKAALPTYYKQKIWTDQEREALRIIKEEKQTKYYNKTPIKVETIEQYKEYVDAVKYWQSIKKYDGKREKGNMQRVRGPNHKERTTNSWNMENRRR